jgi:hypothetical protein
MSASARTVTVIIAQVCVFAVRRAWVPFSIVRRYTEPRPDRLVSHKDAS